MAVVRVALRQLSSSGKAHQTRANSVSPNATEEGLPKYQLEASRFVSVAILELTALISTRFRFFRFDFSSGFFWLSITFAMCLRNVAVSILAISNKLSC